MVVGMAVGMAVGTAVGCGAVDDTTVADGAASADSLATSSSSTSSTALFKVAPMDSPLLLASYSVRRMRTET